MVKVSIFWFCRDFCLYDNVGFYYVFRGVYLVLFFFIFDWEILDDLESFKDVWVEFLYDIFVGMKEFFEQEGYFLLVWYGFLKEIWLVLLKEFDVVVVYINWDYEFYVKEWDQMVGEMLDEVGVLFYDFKDYVIFEAEEVQKKIGGNYIVFMFYSCIWKEVLSSCMDLFINLDGEWQ